MVMRLAIAVGVLLFLGVVAATFLPTSPEGKTCGTWVAPEWTDEAAEELLSDLERLEDQSLDGPLSTQSEITGMAAAVAESKRVCDDALSTRRTVSLVLVGLMVLVPLGVVFVGSGRRPPTPA